MGKTLRPDDGRLKVNRDATRAKVEAILRRGLAPNIAPLLRARRDQRFQVFLRAVIRSAMA